MMMLVMDGSQPAYAPAAPSPEALIFRLPPAPAAAAAAAGKAATESTSRSCGGSKPSLIIGGGGAMHVTPTHGSPAGTVAAMLGRQGQGGELEADAKPAPRVVLSNGRICLAPHQQLLITIPGIVLNGVKVICKRKPFEDSISALLSSSSLFTAGGGGSCCATGLHMMGAAEAAYAGTAVIEVCPWASGGGRPLRAPMTAEEPAAVATLDMVLSTVYCDVPYKVRGHPHAPLSYRCWPIQSHQCVVMQRACSMRPCMASSCPASSRTWAMQAAEWVARHAPRHCDSWPAVLEHIHAHAEDMHACAASCMYRPLHVHVHVRRRLR